MREHGFTLVEMIVVIVITGIIGSVVAVFIQAPVQGYVDSARRAELTDIADTAFRRVARDLRLALPNSVRVTGTCGDGTTCYLEFIPTKGGGRYRAGAPGDQLLFTVADTSFEVLGPMPAMDSTATPPDHIVVYNLGIAGADAYAGSNRTAVSAAPLGTIANITSKKFPFDSPGHRFHVVTTPTSFACSQNSTNPAAGTLSLVNGYAWGASPSTGTVNLLAGNVGSCGFTYDANVVAQRSGLVTMRLAITQDGETVSLYSATHVSNQP
jgi:MSHA biogenesis protein MshO